MGTAKRFFAVLAVVAAFPYFLAAQADESGSRVAKTGEGFLISQTISFPPIPNMLYYKVELEQFVGENSIPFDTIQTETNSVEVVLKAGLYRYRIFAYNKMNLLDGVSDWQKFEVLAAVEPVLETYRPFYGLYYEMSITAGSITVAGRDFFPESEFALVKQPATFDWSSVDLEGRKDVIFPDHVTVSDDHTLALLSFRRKDLKVGEYLIFVRNPGGLWTTLGQVRTGFRKDIDWTLSFGWSPMIAAFDLEADTYWDYDTFDDEPVLDVFNPRGAYLRLGWFPIKTRIGNFGLELNWLFLADNYWVSRHDDPRFGDYFATMHGGHVDIVYQNAPPAWRNWQFEIRAGIGSGSAYDNEFYDSAGIASGGAYDDEFYDNAGIGSGSAYDNEFYDSDEAIPLLINLGFSAQYFIWKNLYAEAGLDFQYMTEVNHFMLRPAVGVGWQFGRWAEAADVNRALKRGEDPSVPVTGKPKNESTLSLGWSPMIPLFNYTYRNEIRYMTYLPDGSVYTYTEYGPEDADLAPFNPLGAYLRAAYLPHRWGDNKFGYEFAIYILDHPNRDTYGDYKYIDLFRYVQFGALYQRRLPKDWQLNARFGVGISNPYDPNYGVDIPFALNFGFSVQRFFWRGLYAEAGLDMVVSLGRETHWMLNPGIGIGWQFNRDAETGLRLK